MIGRTLAYRRLTVALAASALFASLGAAPAAALEPSPVAARIDAALAANRQQLIEWRRHLHQNPELGNREVETAKFVAERLRSFGLEPRTGVARTGVVAVIEGGRPGPVVALRADMDALPVTEEVDLPFASKATATWEGKTVGVMHACGHDTHVAMLLDAAQALVSVRKELPGKVVLVFQPAEEGVPLAEQPAGAELMLKEGVFDDPKVDVVFGLHVFAQLRERRPRLPPRAAPGRRRPVRDRGPGPTDARLEALGRDRPDRRRQRDRDGAPDDRLAHARHHPRARGRHRRPVRRGRPQQHHPGPGSPRRHDPHVRRGDAERRPRAGAADRRGRGRGARDHRAGRDREGLPGHRQRPGAHATDAPDPRAAGARRRSASCRRSPAPRTSPSSPTGSRASS